MKMPWSTFVSSDPALLAEETPGTNIFSLVPQSLFDDDFVVAPAANGWTVVTTGVGAVVIPSASGGGVAWIERRSVRGIANGKYSCADCSSDGAVIVLGEWPGRLWTSLDRGVTWTERRPAGADADQNWRGAACSANGSFMVVVAANYGVFTSTDYGVTWTERQPIGANYPVWDCVACDSDGSDILVGSLISIVPNSGKLYLSTDGGVNWSETQPAGAVTRDWKPLAMDDDGSFLVAGVSGGRLYTSADGGTTWIERQPGGAVDLLWNLAACDSDGSHIVVGSGPAGRLYRSVNSGVAWAETQPAGAVTRSWNCLAMDSDGSNVLVGIDNGLAYTSTDSAATWGQTSPKGVANGYWYAAASSADGSALFLAEGSATGGRVFVSPSDGLTIKTNTVNAWNANGFWRQISATRLPCVVQFDVFPRSNLLDMRAGTSALAGLDSNLPRNSGGLHNQDVLDCLMVSALGNTSVPLTQVKSTPLTGWTTVRIYIMPGSGVWDYVRITFESCDAGDAYPQETTILETQANAPTYGQWAAVLRAQFQLYNANQYLTIRRFRSWLGYATGEIVTATAYAGAGHRFSGWRLSTLAAEGWVPTNVDFQYSFDNGVAAYNGVWLSLAQLNLEADIPPTTKRAYARLQMRVSTDGITQQEAGPINSLTATLDNVPAGDPPSWGPGEISNIA